MKVLNTVYAAIVGLLLLSTLTMLLSVAPLPSNLKFLTVLSGSMEPAIGTGSVVAVRPAHEYKVGDIITFQSPSGSKVPTTHRIVSVTEEDGVTVYETRGDANNVADMGKIPARAIMGKVLFHIPLFGYVIAGARTKYGFIALLVIPGTIVIADQLVKIYREIRRIKTK